MRAPNAWSSLNFAILKQRGGRRDKTCRQLKCLIECPKPEHTLGTKTILNVYTGLRSILPLGSALDCVLTCENLTRVRRRIHLSLPSRGLATNRNQTLCLPLNRSSPKRKSRETPSLDSTRLKGFPASEPQQKRSEAHDVDVNGEVQLSSGLSAPLPFCTLLGNIHSTGLNGASGCIQQSLPFGQGLQ